MKTLSLLDGYPIPPCPDCPPIGPVEALLSFMVAYLLMVVLVLWLIPRDSRIALIAFGKGPKE